MMTTTTIENHEAVANKGSELEAPIWSVISFDDRIVSGLTYMEAQARLAALHIENVSGLCIVSDLAAANVETA